MAIPAIPFRQLAFEALPESPRVPHRFYALAERFVAVSTPALGETRVSVRVTGQGPPLLLVHGLMTTAYSWRYVFESLAERFTVYAVDLPGAGRTSTPAAPCTPEALADWLHALVEALGIVGAAVIGNSMGGYLTMVWALKYPSDLARLVVLHSPAAPIPRLYGLWAGVRMPRALWLLRRVVGGPDRLRGFLSHLRDTMDVMALARFRDALLSRRQAGHPFPVPLLLVYARRDPMVPPAIGHQLRAWIPDAGMVRLDEASHFAHVDAPERFLGAVLPFLKQEAA